MKGKFVLRYAYCGDYGDISRNCETYEDALIERDKAIIALKKSYGENVECWYDISQVLEHKYCNEDKVVRKK